MTPATLIVIIAVLAVARLVIAVRPAAVPDDAQRNIIREYLDAFIVAGIVMAGCAAANLLSGSGRDYCHQRAVL